MKILKIVLGSLIIYSAFSAFAKLLPTERGAGLLGVLIGVILLVLLGIWLIKSGVNEKK
jgi:flagellar biogenesis protein FliO